MLITIQELRQRFNIHVTGILHVGAHKCEELVQYLQLGVPKSNIYWIEALQELVDEMRQNDRETKIYQAVISETDNEVVTFNITRNDHTGDTQSSSILEFGSHATSHPQVKVVDKRMLLTSRLETVIAREQIDMTTVNFMNLDIQGVELRALKSMEQHLKHIKYIYTEVNTEQVYKGCDQMSDLTDYLSRFGFRLADKRIYSQFGWGDAFYIRGDPVSPQTRGDPVSPLTTLWT